MLCFVFVSAVSHASNTLMLLSTNWRIRRWLVDVCGEGVYRKLCETENVLNKTDWKMLNISGGLCVLKLIEKNNRDDGHIFRFPSNELHTYPKAFLKGRPMCYLQRAFKVTT